MVYITSPFSLGCTATRYSPPVERQLADPGLPLHPFADDRERLL
jgi:hypothetical protein